jgi:hypothetical protein
MYALAGLAVKTIEYLKPWQNAGEKIRAAGMKI